MLLIVNTHMKAVGLYKALPIEHPDALVDLTLPVPIPGITDLLIRVDAISVNPADYRARSRKEDDGQPTILGWDVAGTIMDTGSAVAPEFRKGDTVYYAGDVTRPGANSEFHLVDFRIVGHAPKHLSPIDAAAVPLTALTAWEAIFERMGFSIAGGNRFENLLIVGGAGGVGSMAIQLAKLIPGLQVIATASRPESQAWCRKLGADEVINHFDNMSDQLAELGVSHVDAVLLLNDPDQHFPALAEILAPQGCICSIVPFQKAPDINLIMRKSAAFVWEFMFTRPMFGTADVAQQGNILNQITRLIDGGHIVSAASECIGTINAENLRTAHARLESGHTIGKLTLAGFKHHFKP